MILSVLIHQKFNWVSIRLVQKWFRDEIGLKNAIQQKTEFLNVVSLFSLNDAAFMPMLFSSACPFSFASSIPFKLM